jgi:pyruvate/2-oxoglutarate dehydrogenase complex dihydrolipoamide dehydrogenase (E3) component
VAIRRTDLVDEHLRTSHPRVFAAGDVTLGPQYVYFAAHESSVAAENALGGTRAIDRRAVPGVTFTTPSIATIGLTEEAGRQAGHEPIVAILPMQAVPRALVNRDERGLFKAVADAFTDEVLGVSHHRGPHDERCGPHDERWLEAGGANLCPGCFEAVVLRGVIGRLERTVTRWKLSVISVLA